MQADHVVGGLRAIAWATFVVALAALAVRGPAGRLLTTAVLALLVGVPLSLLALAAVRWAYDGRTGLAGLAAALLLVVVLGGVIAAVL